MAGKGKNHLVEGTHPVRAIKELNTHTDEDKIIEYLNSEKPDYRLSKKLAHLLERYEYAFEMYKSRRSVQATIAVLMKKDWGDGPLCRRTARRDLQMAQRIFSDGSEHNRKMMVDFEIEQIKKDIESARIDKDYKAVARLRELMLKYINDHMGDNDAELYKQLQPSVIMIGRFPEKLKTPLPDDDELFRRMENLKKKRVTDYLEAEDTQYQADAK